MSVDSSERILVCKTKLESNALNLAFDRAHLDHVGLVPHAADLRHIPHLLLNQGGLKCHQHEKCKNAVVPVFIQTPQPHTENLMVGRQ